MPVVEALRFVQVLVRGRGIPKHRVGAIAKGRRIAEWVGRRGVIHRGVS